MNRTQIEWVKNPDGTQGYTWNPITGCLNGCEYCYARKIANTRLKERYLANDNIAVKPTGNTRLDECWAIREQDPFYPRFWPERIDKMPYFDRGLKPKGIFVCDMSDLFGIGIPKEWTEEVLEYISCHPIHRFYLLTKQPQNLVKFSPFPDNCWVGVSATDDVMFRIAWNQLRQVEAKVKYISFEPLLKWDMGFQSFPVWIEDVDWVIIGSQTKPTVMPKIEWVREIVKACDKAGVKVFLKDNLYDLFMNVAHSDLYWEDMSNLRQEMANG